MSTRTVTPADTSTAAATSPAATLGDELRLLHGRTEIASSAFATMVNARWNGSEFAP